MMKIWSWNRFKKHHPDAPDAPPGPVLSLVHLRVVEPHQPGDPVDLQEVAERYAITDAAGLEARIDKNLNANWFALVVDAEGLFQEHQEKESDDG